MKNKKLFDKVFIFTNWGIVEGVICEILESATMNTFEDEFSNPTLYKCNINIDKYENECIEHDFYYEIDDLFITIEDAIKSINLK